MVEQVYRLARAWADRPASRGRLEPCARAARPRVGRPYRPRRLVDIPRRAVRSARHRSRPARVKLAARRRPGSRRICSGSRPSRSMPARRSATTSGRSPHRPELIWPRYRAAVAGWRIALYQDGRRTPRRRDRPPAGQPGACTPTSSAMLLLVRPGGGGQRGVQPGDRPRPGLRRGVPQPGDHRRSARPQRTPPGGRPPLRAVDPVPGTGPGREAQTPVVRAHDARPASRRGSAQRGPDP